MSFYSASNAQMFVPTTQYLNPGVFIAAPSMSALCQQPQPISASASPLPYSWLGRYGLCFSRSASVVLGILLIGCGGASLGGATMALMFFAEFSDFGTGFWCGAVFVCAGGIAIAAGHHRTDSLIVATTVTSGLTVAFGITQLTMGALSLAHDRVHWECPIWKCTNQPPYDCHCYSWEHGAIVASSLMVCAAALAAVFGFSLFVYCVKTTCCKDNQQMVSMTTQYLPIYPQQLQTEAGSKQKVISIPVQVQCSPTSISDVT